VSAFTPGTTETCVWQKSFETLATRQAEPSQTAGGRQENGGVAYDIASASLLAEGGGGGGVAETLPGSGPAPGVLEVSARRPSVGAIQNYNPGNGVEFVFDPKAERFVVGSPNGGLPPLTSPHQYLSGLIGADNSTVVGGIFQRGSNGEMLLNDFSGHYWQNWTPQIKQQVVDFLQQKTGQQTIFKPAF